MLFHGVSYITVLSQENWTYINLSKIAQLVKKKRRFGLKASLVALLVKNPHKMWETCIRSLDWEDPLEKDKATHSSILAWRIPWTV